MHTELERRQAEEMYRLITFGLTTLFFWILAFILCILYVLKMVIDKIDQLEDDNSVVNCVVIYDTTEENTDERRSRLGNLVGHDLSRF